MLALISLLELLIIELYTLWKKTSITHDWLIFAHTERRQVFFCRAAKSDPHTLVHRTSGDATYQLAIREV